MLHLEGDTVRGRLFSAIKALKIRFPTAEIAEKTGYNKTTVSEYLKNKEPSETFIRTFCEQYNVDFDSLWKGESLHNGNDQFSAAQLFAMAMKIIDAQTAQLNRIENKMALEGTQGRIETNLQDVRKDVTKLVERQGAAIKEMRRHFEGLTVRKRTPSKGADKREDHNGDNP